MTTQPTDPYQPVEPIEHDLMAMKPAEPSADLDRRVATLLTVEHPLSRMALREPTAALDSRVAALLTGAAEPSRILPGAGAWRIALPLAACLAVGVTAFFVARTETAGPIESPIAIVSAPAPALAPAVVPEIQPVRYDRTLVSDEAGDVMILDDQLPVVPIRRQSIQQTRWVDEQNNIQIDLTVPREQMLIVPVQVDEPYNFPRCKPEDTP